MREGLKGDKYDLRWNKYESIEKEETYMLIIYVMANNLPSFLYKKNLFLPFYHPRDGFIVPRNYSGGF